MHYKAFTGHYSTQGMLVVWKERETTQDPESRTDLYEELSHAGEASIVNRGKKTRQEIKMRDFAGFKACLCVIKSLTGSTRWRIHTEKLILRYHSVFLFGNWEGWTGKFFSPHTLFWEYFFVSVYRIKWPVRCRWIHFSELLFFKCCEIELYEK